MNMDRLTLVEGNQNSAVAAVHEQAGEKVCAAGNEAQHNEAAQAPLDSGLLSLVMLARFHGVATKPDQTQLQHGCQRGSQSDWR